MKNAIYSTLGGYIAEQVMQDQFNYPDLPENANQPEEISPKTTKAQPFSWIQTSYQTLFGLKTPKQVEDCR